MLLIVPGHVFNDGFRLPSQANDRLVRTRDPRVPMF